MEERGLLGFRFHPMYYPDEQVLTTPQNRPLWEALDAMGAVIQFHLNAACADQVAEIARRHPQMPLLLDHMGYPNLDEPAEAFQPIVELAGFDNVAVKISDVHGRSRENFPYADVHPFIQRLHQAFGAERMLWGTGYPGSPSHQAQLADLGRGVAPSARGFRLSQPARKGPDARRYGRPHMGTDLTFASLLIHNPQGRPA